MRKCLLILSGGAVLFSASCKTAKPVQTANTSQAAKTEAKVVTRDTASANFALTILLNVTEKNNMTYYNVTKVVKRDMGERKTWNEGPGAEDLVAVFMDSLGKEVERVSFRNPMKKLVKGAGEKSETPEKQATSTSRTTVVRVNYDKRIYRMEIEDKAGKKLGSVELKKFL